MDWEVAALAAVCLVALLVLVVCGAALGGYLG